MRIWRIEKARHADAAFSGEGSARAGGRWHRRGVRVVYASESRALAALEHLLQAPHRVLRSKLVCFEARIPDVIEIEVLNPGALPRNWDRSPPPRALQQIGSHWIESGKKVYTDLTWAIGFAPNWLANEIDKRGIGGDRVLFATDQPWGDFAGEYHRMVDAVGDRELADMIFYENFDRLYG